LDQKAQSGALKLGFEPNRGISQPRPIQRQLEGGHPDLTPGMPITLGQPMLGQAFGIPSFGLPPSQQNR
jgi:hypothetical protein